VLAAFFSAMAAAQGAQRLSGVVLDPVGRPLAAARVDLRSTSGRRTSATTDSDGRFSVALIWGEYTVRAQAKGFAPIEHSFMWTPTSQSLVLRLTRLAAASEDVVVNGGIGEIALDAPDPSQKILVREQLLDANPGRPGAPISIPGLPIETAAGGIKAPQYFVPGVAGDHGEPIAQYIAVGGYLLTNNLSANAHGNGYADPNIYVSAALGSVATDGGAFNVLEGNHALNLAATYSLRPRLSRFFTLTGDYRDVDLTAGFAPLNPDKKEWLAVQANYGNGLLKDLEHRRQFKWNGQRVYHPGKQEITLVGIGYFGASHEGNLVPIGFAAQVNDTLDPRQKDQTHTALLAIDDRSKLTAGDELAFSGFFRTYNLALYSNFGEGLIRQSEFRTVEGAQARETHTFTTLLEGMIGLDYHQDDIHRDNLDHFLSSDVHVYGAFLKVLSSDVTIRDLTPFAALHGELGKHLRFYAGLRPDTIELKNIDTMNPAHSFDRWSTFLAPKATLAWTPGTGSIHWLPAASFSIGQAFFTQDPRISVESSATPQGFERSHSEQLVLEKAFASTDLRVTLGRTTTTETLGKIDPDNGSEQPLGPGTLNFLTASVEHRFSGFGTLQAVLSKADARLLGGIIDGQQIAAQITPEAPRTIFDLLATLDRLPMGLRGRSEYEYVGHKQLDLANPRHPSAYEAIPVGETRLAVVRPFLSGRLELGANGMLARGYTGQTTETFNPGWQLGAVPYCAPGSGPSGAGNDFDCGTNEQSVGIRMVSWAGGSISWRFGAAK